MQHVHKCDISDKLQTCFLPVVPLNIGLLNVFGRKVTLALLQLLAAVFFMLLNICSTM